MILAGAAGAVSNAYSVVGIVAALFAVVAIAVVAVYVGKSKLVSENLERSRDLIDTLEKQNDALEKQVIGLRADLTIEKQRSDAQGIELGALRQLVQGIDAMNRLSTKIDEFEDKIEESHSQIMVKLLQLGDRR